MSKKLGQNKQCFVYARVSTEDQAKEGYSIRAQRKTCVECARKHGYKVSEIFVDEGQSATAADRPKFQEMLDKCEEGGVSAVIVYHTDRFARNTLDHLLIKKKLRECGVKLVSVAQPMLDETPEGRLMDTVLAGVNEFYSKDLSRKTMKGMVQRFSEGWWPGWAPLGYANTPKSEEKILPDEKTAPFIKKVFKLYSTGNYSIFKLTKLLHKWGVRTRTGKPIQHSTLGGILTNPFYCGLMKWDGMEKMGAHKPLVDKATFELCRYVAAKHRNFLIRERKHNFVLRGFVFCKPCGMRYTAEWHVKDKAGNKIAYYHCNKRTGCKQPYVEMGKLETKVEELFKKFQFSQKFIDIVVRKTRKVLDETRGAIENEKRSLYNQKTALETKRNKLEDMLLDDTITRDTFKRKHSGLQNQIDSLQEQIGELNKKRNVDINFIEEVLAFTRNIYETYKEAPPFLKRHYLRFFFEKVFVENKKIAKVEPSLIFATLKKEQALIIRKGWLPGLDSNQ